MKPRKEFISTDILIVISIIFIVWSVLYTSFTLGKMAGRNEYREMVKRTDCEVGYGSKPQSEITGECLKYFKMQEGN